MATKLLRINFVALLDYNIKSVVIQSLPYLFPSKNTFFNAGAVCGLVIYFLPLFLLAGPFPCPGMPRSPL
jgi:hypothetical protein